ncbi:hypothetical protein EJ02DRAFT_466750 [Clathrospora elynae]|uniref:Uncharacterized protein n=1 Tax=Clathrospora elynae TaxID=706981 RepID=A0A6A5SMY4_9PLEO|nr:hypothetical protein EJ02DRAFT_466750 [Clathrospora elynae]
MYKAGIKVGTIVPKELACLPGIDPQSIQANHVNVTFQNGGVNGYRILTGNVRSVHMGDASYQDKIENNWEVVIGYAHSTAIDGFKMTNLSMLVFIPMPLSKRTVPPRKHRSPRDDSIAQLSCAQPGQAIECSFETAVFTRTVAGKSAPASLCDALRLTAYFPTARPDTPPSPSCAIPFRRDSDFVDCGTLLD